MTRTLKYERFIPVSNFSCMYIIYSSGYTGYTTVGMLMTNQGFYYQRRRQRAILIVTKQATRMNILGASWNMIVIK